MRNAIYIPMLLLCLLTAACSREATTDRNVSSAAVTSAEVQAPAPTDVVLADGYTPSFTHVLRSQRHEESESGTFRHFVIVEYLDADRGAVVKVLQADLKSQGFTVENTADSKDSSRLSARKGSTKLVIVVNDSSNLALNDPNARGLVHFSWLDRNAR